jgi:hypothetical protein
MYRRHKGLAMHVLTIAFSAAILAAGATYAQGSRSALPTQQTAGILTCTTKPEASLVFGNTPVAECTFVADRGSFKQTYLALFSRMDRPQAEPKAQTVKWQVMTKDGFARPGMLSGLFNTPASGEHDNYRSMPDLTGHGASLKLLSHSGTGTAKFAVSTPRIRLAAATEGLTR